MSTETTIAEKTVHRVVAAWKGEEPGSCGFECACGDTFDGFDSIAEAEACHKALPVEPAQVAEAPKPNPDPRAEYVAGLRQLADLVEQHPELLLPHTGTSKYSPITVVPVVPDLQREQLAAWARALPGRKEKNEGGTNGEYLQLFGRVGVLYVQVLCDRDEVCERVVTGTREVTEEVPDPNAPKVTVTKVVEDVKWVCRPLLADESSEVSA